ncbi:Uncharacterized protein T01_1754 [Trichinella spiralis]|uniref:SCAN domain-containing protein 3 n=1 Tax=Trichinella spiralis TaxID=6334 RepID=A0A0V1BM60_TRISP|nr:Uncharacterized protein T01_1754 [Trichinella spiralis]
MGVSATHRKLLGEQLSYDSVTDDLESLFLSGFKQHAVVVRTGISTKADGELINLSVDFSFKVSFDRKTLTHFCLSVQNKYPTLSTAALKLLLPFTTSYLCEIGFSSINRIKRKFRNKLKLSNIFVTKTNTQ